MIRRIVISILVSAVLIFAMFRMVLKSDPAQLAEAVRAMRSLSIPLLCGALACQLGQALIRACRYRFLLLRSGDGAVPSAGRIFLVTLVRNAFVDMLPARAGELSYLAMLNRGCGVGAGAAVSSMAVSVLFDFVALALLLLGLIAAPMLRNRQSLILVGVSVVVLALVCAVGFVGIFRVLPWMLDRVKRLAAGRRLHRLVAAGIDFLDRLNRDLAAIRDRGTAARVLAFSIGVRVLKYTAVYLMFLAVTRVAFPAMAGAPMWSVVIALIMAEGAVGLPLPSFMGFGMYEAGGAAAWKLLGFEAGMAAIVMLALHIVSQVLDYTLGILGAGIFTLTNRRPVAAVAVTSRRRRLAVALALAAGLVVAAGLVAWQYRGLKKLGALRPPAKGAAVTPAPAAGRAMTDAMGELRGFMVWCSNRDGNHDILRMDFPSGAIHPVTRHPHVDTFPAISPDGRLVAFARSQVAWVSQRNAKPWDVYVVDMETGRERLVARDSNFPTWSSDGSCLYLQRNVSSVVEHRLEDGRERVLFESGRDPVPANVELQLPDFSDRAGTLAVTLRGARRGTMLYGLNGMSAAIGDGCQTSWAPDGTWLCYMDTGGRQKTLIRRFDPATGTSSSLLDLPGEFSHEYFPRFSNDGRYLAFGASTGGHEHDTEDYEIFVWPVGAPADAAVRLTFHTGNDCWPDVFLAR